jgi:hypothetical protein
MQADKVEMAETHYSHVAVLNSQASAKIYKQVQNTQASAKVYRQVQNTQASAKMVQTLSFMVQTLSFMVQTLSFMGLIPTGWAAAQGGGLPPKL